MRKALEGMTLLNKNYDNWPHVHISYNEDKPYLVDDKTGSGTLLKFSCYVLYRN